ncbi:MAG: hypothetical protein ACYC63_07860 [Armatimonadota bacterium]
MPDYDMPEDEGKRIIALSQSVNALIENLTAEEVKAWAVDGDTSVLPMMMPEMVGPVEVYGRIIKKEYDIHEQARLTLGNLCPSCRNGADFRRVVWQASYQVWVILCDCGEDVHIQAASPT